MLKAIKECLKNWLVIHERLYWYIVIGLAVLGFGIVTALGCAKLEKANAAETSDGVYYPSWSSIDFSGCENDWSAIADKYQHCVVGYHPTLDLYRFAFVDDRYWSVDSGGSAFEPYVFYYRTNNFHSLECSWGIDVNADGSVLNEVKLGGLQINHDSYTGGYELIGTTFTILPDEIGRTDYVATLPQNNIVHPRDYVETVYSPDAPYVKLEGVSWSNLYLDGKPLLFHLGSTFDNKTKYSGWGYSGKLSDFDSTGATSYRLNVDYVVELPTWEYVKELCEIKGVPYYGWDTCDSSQMLRSIWDSNEDIPKHVYRFTYPVTLEDGINFNSSDGSFGFSLSFEEIEVLIRYFNDTAFQQLRNDIAYEDEAEELRAHYLSYLHIDEVRIVVHADMVGSSVYGPMTVNVFQRNMKSAPLVKVVDVDYLSELESSLDDVVNESVMSGFEEYYKSLEEKIDGLEAQLQDIYLVEDGFGGDLKSSDLWVSFRSLAEGLAGMAPAISAIATLSGSVLSFLPLQMTGIMSFTLLAICIIAIIKAIRG